MPRRADDGTHFRYHEKVKAGLGSQTQRLGSDSQLPFGYCCLSLHPVRDAVITPSGHLYEREVILEYLLTKTRELKLQAQAYEEEQVRLAAEAERKSQEEVAREMTKFAESEDGVDRIVKRKSTAVEEQHSFLASRKRVIDDTDRETQMKQLKEINPWLPQFTPHAEETRLKKPPKRPSSPMTSRPLRVSDLIPINMHREIPAEQGGTSSETTVKFICPVSRKSISSQKVVANKKSHEIMLESVAEELAYPTMTCPLTGGKFTRDDIIPLARAASSFASTGDVVAKKYRPSIN